MWYSGSLATGRNNTPSVVRKSARSSSLGEISTSSRKPANRERYDLNSTSGFFVTQRNQHTTECVVGKDFVEKFCDGELLPIAK
jgi:hypothetical protein